jgi:hypothetical protein
VSRHKHEYQVVLYDASTGHARAADPFLLSEFHAFHHDTDTDAQFQVEAARRLIANLRALAADLEVGLHLTEKGK